jgi:hypothetical protein
MDELKNEATIIIPCSGEWFLIHRLGDDKQSIYPVVCWERVNGNVIGLISVENNEGRLAPPPPGNVVYKTRSELTDEQYTACMAGKIYTSSQSDKAEYAEQASRILLKNKADALHNLICNMLRGIDTNSMESDLLRKYLYDAGVALHNLPYATIGISMPSEEMLEDINMLDPDAKDGEWGPWVREYTEMMGYARQ